MTPRGGLPDTDAVVTIDALAAAWITQAAPVRFGVAVSAADLEAVYRLRYEVVVAQGWAAVHSFPNGLERDSDDAAAVQVAGWHGNRVVATGRLVQPAAGRRLPTEAAFDFALSGRERLIDVGRVCVAPACRSVAHRVFRGVLGQIWREMRRRDCEEAATVVTATVARTYERWGLRVTALAPPRTYWGESRFPARIAPAAAMGRLLPTVGTSAHPEPLARTL